MNEERTVARSGTPPDTLAPDPETFIGRTVGRYRLERVLGVGGCGMVFGADDPELGRQVAVKLVLHDNDATARGREHRERLLREARAMAQLRHGNVVEVFDVGLTDIASSDGVYIVMEYVRGQTLRAWQASPDLAPAAVIEAYLAAARGLAAAHALGVIHRDFKPANTMRSTDGQVRVLDFGLAAAEQEGLVGGSSARWSSGSGALLPVASGSAPVALTRTGTVMGTPLYMAPEQHRGRSATAAVDQYAWCVALWESLAGRPPFSGDDMTSLVRAKVKGPPPIPERSRMPTGVGKVLRRGLQPRPDDRYPSMGALVSAMEAATRPRRRGVFVAGGGVALGLGLWALQSTDLPLCADETPARWHDDVELRRLADTLSGSPMSFKWGTQVAAHHRLGRFVEQWTVARDRVCGPDSAMTGREAKAAASCLERAAGRFDTILGGLDDEVTDWSPMRRLWSASPPERCLSVGADELYRFDAGDDRELDTIATRPAVSLVDPDLRTEARTFVEANLPRARELEDHWAIARLLIRQAGIAYNDGELENAAASYAEAAWQAEAAGDVLLAAELTPWLMVVNAERGLPAEADERIDERCEALLTEAGDPSYVRASFESIRATTAFIRGDPEEAGRIAMRSLERIEAEGVPGTERQRVETALALIASHVELDRHFEARRVIEDVHRWCLRGAEWCEDSRERLESMASVVSFLAGFEDEAIRFALEAVAVGSRRERGHPQLESDIAFYGFLLAARGTDEGIEQLKDAISKSIARRGMGDSRLAPMLANLAGAQQWRGDYEDALQSAADSRDSYRAIQGPNGASFISTSATHIELLVQLGRIAEAEQELAALEANANLDEQSNAFVLVGRIALRLAQKRYEEAERDLGRMWELLPPSIPGLRPTGDRGVVAFRFAQARLGLGDVQGADRASRLAQDLLAHGHFFHRAHAGDVQRWRTTELGLDVANGSK